MIISSRSDAIALARADRMTTLVAWNDRGDLQDIMQADLSWLWRIYVGACRWHRRKQGRHVGQTWARVVLVSANGSDVWSADFADDARIAKIIAEFPRT